MPSGAELFTSTLQHWGVNEVFTLVGDHLNDVLLAMSERSIKLIDMRHESGCTHAAEAWSRIHRRPAVSLVTGGPGHTNAMTGLAAAYLAACPLVAVSGAPPRRLAGKGAFQDIDQLSMTRAVTKWCGEPSSVEEVPMFLDRAFRIAMEGRPGPVHLTIPVDLFSGKTEEAEPLESIDPKSNHGEVLPEYLTAMVEMLKAAQRPMVVAGSGVWWASAGGLLEQFIEQASLPLLTLAFGRGVVPDSHPLCFGYADAALNRAAAAAFREADVVLVLGKRIDYRLSFGGARLFSAETKFLQVDIEATELGRNRELAFEYHGDLNDVLGTLVKMPVEWPDRSEWLQRLTVLRSEWQQSLAERGQDQSTPIAPPTFFQELSKHIPEGALYAWDGGDFVHWGRAILPANQRGGWMRLGPMAAIGSGLPNAVSLKLAHPDRPVILFTGDGSLGFYMAEIDTLVRHGLPVVIIVGNDAGWGLERELQSARKSDPVACELRATRYDIITQGFGGEGELIERLDQIGPAMHRALSSRVPYCLNVQIRGQRSPFTEWQVAGMPKSQ